MSAAELKANLHARIDALDEQHLAVAERVFLELEIKELEAQICADFDAARGAGQLEPHNIQALIDQFRKEHPYR